MGPRNTRSPSTPHGSHRRVEDRRVSDTRPVATNPHTLTASPMTRPSPDSGRPAWTPPTTQSATDPRPSRSPVRRASSRRGHARSQSLRTKTDASRRTRRLRRRHGRPVASDRAGSPKPGSVRCALPRASTIGRARCVNAYLCVDQRATAGGSDEPPWRSSASRHPGCDRGAPQLGQLGRRRSPLLVPA